MTTNNTELLPCPFCGGHNIEIDHWCVMPDNYHASRAICLDCEVDGPTSLTLPDGGWMPDKESAEGEGVKAWNRRAAPVAQIDPWAPSGNDYDRAIHHNPDAKAWADFFVDTFPGLADKHGLMLGWFANAMMAMHDHLARKAEPAPEQPGKFKLGDRVRKTKGSQWKGVVVGTYSTDLTPEGYAVESDTERGSVQIYPAAALELRPTMELRPAPLPDRWAPVGIDSEGGSCD